MNCLESQVNNDVVHRRQLDPPRLWFAVYTSHRHEKHVAELLEEQGIETVLPVYKVERHWKKSVPVVLELPLFPCYLFVHIDRSARSSVLGLPGVVSIVGSPSEPWPLPSSEVEALRLGTQLARLQPCPYVTVGDRVRIKTGPMSGVQGILAQKTISCGVC